MNPGSFIPLMGVVYGWQLLSSICFSQIAFTVTQTSAVATEMLFGMNENLVYLSHRHFVMFFVTAVQKQLVNLMPFPDTGFCSGHFIVQPSLPVPFPVLTIETAFFISVYVLNMICS